MIGQAVRHGRSARDARNLCNHLLKDKDARIEIFNSAAFDLQSVVDDMQLYRDGSKADAAILHFSLSPARDMSDDELRKVADIVAKHFDAEHHPAALVIHHKDRSSGQGNTHAHFVVGRIDENGNVIPSGFEKIRLETAMRIAEYELGEPAMLGRHHASSVKWLRENGRDDVADFLVMAHGENPEKPKSSATPAKRQMIERQSEKTLSEISNEVKSAWERSDNGLSFSAALNECGLEVLQGQKPGVFIISHNGIEIGALDRLLKEKRAIVKNRMGDLKYEQAAEPASSNESDLSRSKSEPKRSGRIETIVATPGADRAGRRRTDRTDTAELRSHTSGTTSLDDNVRRYGKESRQFDEKQAMISLDKVRLSSTTVIATQEIKSFHKPFLLYDLHKAAIDIEAHKSGWDWVQNFRDDLLDKIRQLKEKMFGSNVKPDEPHDDNQHDYHDDDVYQPMRFG